MTDGWTHPLPEGWEEVADAALLEDIGSGDVSACLLPADLELNWIVESQSDGVLCGAGIAFDVLALEDEVVVHLQDGAKLASGTKVLSGKSPASHLLSTERTVLNFLMHLSGIATLTSRYGQEIAGTKAHIIDTRKTTPGLRTLEKYAVRCGGGSNHRMGLFDGVMIKDNHIQALGGIAAAVNTARAQSHHLLKIEVETANLEQVEEAIRAGADVVMLDNMAVNDMAEAVKRWGGKCIFEASGGIDLSTVRAVAETGVDLISVGAITHSAPALPFHLEVR